MALTVGELNGIITIDDRTVDPALRRVENAMRSSGERMSEEAERAGEEAGQQLGQGLVRGADGQWRTMQGELADAVTAAAAEAEAQARRGGRQVGDRFEDGVQTGARQAGDELADGVRRGAGEAENAAEDAGEQASEGFFSRMRGRASQGVGDLAGSIREGLSAKLGLAAVGAAAGAALMAAFTQAMEQGKITARLGAQLGVTGPEAQRYGKIAGELYTGAVTETFQGGADTMRAIASAGLIPPKATNAQLKSIATNVADLADLMEVDVTQAASAAGTMVRNGLAKDGKQALDLLVKGSRGLGVASEDLLETFTEYGPTFKAAGLSGQTALGLIRQAVKGGWGKDSDKIGDAFKELNLRVTSGAKASSDALKSLGLDSQKLADDMSAGGTRGEEAMDTVLNAIRKVGPDSQTAKKAVQDLFGGPGEDLGAALFELNVGDASKAMGNATGEADKLGNAMRDNAATKVEQFKRGMQQGVVDFLGGTVIPAFSRVKTAIGRIWDDAGKGNPEAADRILAFFDILAQRAKAKITQELAPRFIEGFSSAGQKLADWIAANPEQALKLSAIAAAIIVAIATLPLLIAGTLAAAATIMMYNFTTRMIDSLNANLPKWWEAFKAWHVRKASEAGSVLSGWGTAMGAWFSGLWSRYISGPVSRQWNSFLSSVRGLPGRSVAALNPLGGGLAAKSSQAWSQFKAAAARKGTEFIGWARGLPGRISASVGSLGGLLTEKGRNVVQGLWNGIKSMGGWIRSQIIGWAKSNIPGPIAKALGIASPSKVTTAQGRWIARGLVAGLTGSAKQVKGAATKLADIVRDSLKPGKRRSRALSVIGSGSKRLGKLAGQEEKLAARMKAATKRVADQIKARDKLAADVKKGVLDAANITGQDTGGWPQTAETILAGLRADRQAADRFAANLAQLRKKGVRADLIAQIAQAGVEQGSSAAAALATASASQIKAINQEQAALVGAAGRAGNTAGQAMYGAGIQAAQGLVRGLQTQQKAIERQMLAIARGMSKAIRKALGIKSPSRVMAAVGAYTAEGLRQGIESGRGAVNRSMSSLVETPSPGSYGWAGAGGRSAAPQRHVFEIRSYGNKQSDLQLAMLRGSIMKKGGGDVDLVLAGRRGA